MNARNKKARKDNGPPNLDLFYLYSGDLSERLLSYATRSDLCKLDAVSKGFSELTAAQWKIITHERFGMRSGKYGWRVGLAFLRRPVYIWFQRDLDDYSETVVAAHNSIVALSIERYPELHVYDAKTFNLIEKRGEEGRGRDITVAGTPGNEFFVSHGANCIEFSCRGHDFAERQRFSFHREDRIPAIGNETHVIFVAGNMLHLNKLSTLPSEAKCVAMRLSVLLGRDPVLIPGERFDNSISWSSDQLTEFVVCHCPDEFCEVSVWTLDADANQITRTQTLELNFFITEIALSDGYIIGGSSARKICVWDRETGVFLHELCDVPYEMLSRYQLECAGPLRMSCHGHILITTSYIGCAICVWNIKTGELLERWNDASENGFISMISENGPDVTSMAYWKEQNGFICGIDGYLHMWSFPINQDQYDRARAIFNAEEEADEE